MRLWTKIAVALAFVPLVASAQFKDLDQAMGNLSRGFGSGDPQAIVAGIGGSDHVQLQFDGLMSQKGFYGRDQAALFLDGLFSKVKPAGFDQQTAKRSSAEAQYHITAQWNIQVNGKPDTRELYITLHQTNAGWSIVSIQSAGK